MLEDFQSDPTLGAAYAYWRAKRGTRAMPRRRDIDPTEIPKLLPNLQIVELVNGGERLRFRLVGTAIVRAYGAEPTGKYFDEMFSGERLRFIQSNYRRIHREKRPLLVYGKYETTMGISLLAHRLILPLSDDGIEVTHCLTVMTFAFPRDIPGWEGLAGQGAVIDFVHTYTELVAEESDDTALKGTH